MMTSEQLKIITGLTQSCEYMPVDAIKTELLKVLFMEENGKKSHKLNLYDYCDKPTNRIAISGVYHDNGFAVATNCKVLIALKDRYSTKYEGKIINKMGEEIKGYKYPAWKSVIPSDYSVINVDNSQLRECISKGKAFAKIEEKAVGTVECGERIVGFEHKLLSALERFINEYPTSKVCISNNSPIIMAEHEGNICIVMGYTYLKGDEHQIKIN